MSDSRKFSERNGYVIKGYAPDAEILGRAREIAGGSEEFINSSAAQQLAYAAQAEIEREQKHGKMIPDYSDIMRLENLVWRSSTYRDYLEYAREYHKLATRYSEDMLILCMEQYNNGSKW